MITSVRYLRFPVFPEKGLLINKLVKGEKP